MGTLDYVECQRLLMRFARALDDGNYEKLCEQMAPDGVWMRQGERLEGRAAVLEALSRRPADVRARHLVTNIEIDFSDDARAECRSSVVVFRHEGADKIPVPMSLPRSVLDYTDTLVKQDGRWLIAHRKSTRIFAK